MQSRRVGVGVLALLLALSTLATPAMAVDQVNGSPDVSLQTPVREFSPGQEVTLPIYVTNAGNIQESGPAEYVERVTTARAMTLDVRSGDSPIEVNTGRYPVGNVPEGTAGPFEISLTIPENATPGTYQLPVRVRYSYSPTVRYGSGTDEPEYRTTDASRTIDVTVRVRDQPRFEILDIASTVPIGGRGTVSMTVQNVGTATASEASLGVEAGDEAVTFGAGTAASRAFSETWAPGENRTFEFPMRIAADAVPRAYPVAATVTYTDERGVARQSRSLTAGVEARTTGSIDLESVTSDLHVGEPGTISGTIRNAGPTAVEDVVLTYDSADPRLTPVDRDVSLGQLAPGERRDFTVELAVDRGTTAGQKRVNFSVRYRDASGYTRASEPIDATVDVAPERDWVSVTPVNATFDIDSENRFVVRVRNTEDIELREVRARLDTAEPFSSASQTAYIPELGPGETATLAFEVTVSEDAVPTQSSVAVNITAERADGETIRLDPTVVPVSVVEEPRTDDVTLLGVAALVVVLVLIAGWWWLNRR